MGKWSALTIAITYGIIKGIAQITPFFLILGNEAMTKYPAEIIFPITILSAIKIREIFNGIDKPITEITEKLKNNKSIKDIIDSYIPKESETNE